MNNIAILNKSTVVTEDQVQQMVTAVASQLWWQAAVVWGHQPRLVYYVAPGQQATSNDWPIVISDTPDQANALGWHTEDQGKVFGCVFAKPVLDAGGDACTKALSVASVLSHEALETMFDWTTNLWADDGTGTLWSYEVCDPCEGDSYNITVAGKTTTVSNFVLPTFFDPQATGKVDWMGTCPGPMKLAKGGYATTVKMNGQPSQIYGEKFDPNYGKLHG